MNNERLNVEWNAELRALGISRYEFEFNKSPNKTNHFIGLGSCGCKVLQFFMDKGLEGKYTGITELDEFKTTPGINHISFTPPRYDPFNLSKPRSLFPDMRQNLVMPEEIKDLFRDNHRYVLIAGLGGYTGTKMVEELSIWLDNIRKVYVTICSLPCWNEGRMRNVNAMNAFARLKLLYNFRYFDYDAMIYQHQNISIFEFYKLGLEKFYETYHLYLQSLDVMRDLEKNDRINGI